MYDLIDNADFLEIRFADEVTVEQLATAIRDSERFTAERELWNLGSPGVRLSAEEVRDAAAAAREKRHRPARTVVLAHNTLSFGLSRIYSVYSEQERNALAVFSDREAAIAWLLDA